MNQINILPFYGVFASRTNAEGLAYVQALCIVFVPVEHFLFYPKLLKLFCSLFQVLKLNRVDPCLTCSFTVFGPVIQKY